MRLRPDEPAAQSQASMRPYLRTLLMRRTDWMESRVLEAASRNGYSAITPAMNRLFGHMRSRAMSLSELARQLGVSRQAVHQIAGQAQMLGLVELLANAQDARVKLVRFTSAGRAMSNCAALELETIERSLAERLGERDLKALKRILSRVWSNDEPPLSNPQQGSRNG